MLLEDSVRFQGTGKLGLRGVDPEHGEMAWVEPAQLEYGYPALHELVVNVHALTFELNLKGPRLRLSHPFRGEGSLCVQNDTYTAHRTCCSCCRHALVRCVCLVAGTVFFFTV